MPKICETLEKELQSGQIPEQLLEYANSLQEKNLYQTEKADLLHQKASKLYQELSEHQPQTYQRCLAHTLKNLALLLSERSTSISQRILAKVLFQKSITLYKQLSADSPNSNLNLSNLGVCYVVFSQSLLKWQPLAAGLYLKNAFAIFASLYQQQPTIFGDQYNRILDLLKRCDEAAYYQTKLIQFRSR
ncbi:hypothetical protein [Thiofilum flexile]|uniref:hypothetical protein n=1 Tax=Thiofilum flexile TaxID=125627 RepID=UPI000372DBCA|nr:hypothetical protein [Thiofilum flexile]